MIRKKEEEEKLTKEIRRQKKKKGKKMKDECTLLPTNLNAKTHTLIIAKKCKEADENSNMPENRSYKKKENAKETGR